MDQPATVSSTESSSVKSPAASPAYASFGQRSAAWLIDFLVVISIQLVVSLPFGALSMLTATLSGAYDKGAGLASFAPAMGVSLIATAIIVVIMFVYRVLLISKKGQTPGMMAIKIKIVKLDGGTPVGTQTALVRYLVPGALDILSLFLSFIGWIFALPINAIDCLWMLWDGKKQTLHDKMAGTVVVKA